MAHIAFPSTIANLAAGDPKPSKSELWPAGINLDLVPSGSVVSGNTGARIQSRHGAGLWRITMPVDAVRNADALETEMFITEMTGGLNTTDVPIYRPAGTESTVVDKHEYVSGEWVTTLRNPIDSQRGYFVNVAGVKKAPRLRRINRISGRSAVFYPNYGDIGQGDTVVPALTVRASLESATPIGQPRGRIVSGPWTFVFIENIELEV